MKKWLSLPVMLVLVSFSSSANADIFGFLTNGPEPAPVVVDQSAPMYAPAQGSMYAAPMYGYPFRSGCCESKSACCTGLWDNFCLGNHFHGFRFGCGSCAAQKGCKGGKGCGSMWGGHLLSKGHCSKGGCGFQGHAACGTCGGCAPCGGKGACGGKHAGLKWNHSTLGLFDWMHYGGKGHCKSGCHGSKGGMTYGWPTKSYMTPSQGYNSTLEVPAPEAVPTPPEVHVAPTPTSLDNSAGHWFRRGPIVLPVSL